MRLTHATRSDFFRSKAILNIHQRQMEFIIEQLQPKQEGYKVCEVSACQILTQKESDSLCKNHLTKFIDNLLHRNQDKLQCTDCQEKISHTEYKVDTDYPLCTNCGYRAYK